MFDKKAYMLEYNKKYYSKEGQKKYHMDHKEVSRKSYIANKEKVLARSKERYDRVKDTPEYKFQHSARQHKRYYGEPMENKMRRLEEQEYKCANPHCKTLLDYSTGHQDHNHETGQMRGVLCGDCNRALGILKEDAKRISGLMEYILKFS